MILVVAVGIAAVFGLGFLACLVAVAGRDDDRTEPEPVRLPPRATRQPPSHLRLVTPTPPRLCALYDQEEMEPA